MNRKFKNMLKAFCLFFSLCLSGLFSAIPIFVVGICGAVGTGKSTIAKKLQIYFIEKGISCSILAQDDYPKRQEKLYARTPRKF